MPEEKKTAAEKRSFMQNQNTAKYRSLDIIAASFVHNLATIAESFSPRLKEKCSQCPRKPHTISELKNTTPGDSTHHVLKFS